jgi:hypothetical protein
MQDIEQKISPLIENMFPSFYREEGQNFVMFVKAYYEWLETNHQVIQLEDTTNFNVGDVVTQDNVTGTVVAFVGEDILVKVDGLETFKCFNICSELIPITSSSGGDTYILRGGATKRLGSVFLSRNLPNIRDIDTTLDLFITQFKEKYLKNIEFDTETNKRMLVKNSLDLYRSKGTSRSIDLFFRLVYGYNSQVFYPGDNLFKLSEGSWVKPQYLEITGSNPQRAVALVGTLIKGITSGAEAFVERYIKRKVNNGFVHILYLSNVQGEFTNRETVYRKSEKPYSDSPRVLGSLTAVDIITGSKEFAVGDIVSFTTETGDYGQARVSSVFDDERGVVEFILLDGGWGYSVSRGFVGEEALDRTQSLITDNTILVSNVQSSNSVGAVKILTAGANYSNSDIITISSQYGSAKFRPITNFGGAMQYATIMEQSGGFFGNDYTVDISSPSGINGSVVPLFKESYLSSFFKVFENLKQNRATIEYGGIANGAQFSIGDVIRIANSTAYDVAYGEVIDNNVNIYSNGQIIMVVANNYNMSVGDSIFQISNPTINADVLAVEDSSASGKVLDISTTATMYINTVVGIINRYDEIYQLNDEGIEIGRAKIANLDLNQTNGILNLSDMIGFFKLGKPILFVGKQDVTAVVTDISLFVSVYGTSNEYNLSNLSKLYGSQTGTTADIVSITGGNGADFKIRSIDDSETIQVNSDLIAGINHPITTANQAFLDVPLNAMEFGFEYLPTGNISSTIYSCLSFANLSIGTIKTLSDINPGDNYSSAPIVRAYQPYVGNYDYNDYVFTVKDASNQYIVGEQVQQSISDTRYNMQVANPQAFRVGERVFQYSSGAVGTVFSVEYPTTNVIVVNKVSNGIFNIVGNVYSYASATNTTNVNSVASVLVPTVAKGVVVEVSGANTVYVKRQQFDNKFELNKTLTGASTGVTANLIQIEEFTGRYPIGFNAQIEGSAFSANGVVTSLQVIDSGYGYSNNQTLVFSSEDGERSGTARALVRGSGTGSGFYKTSKGFLSNLSKVHDGDYYQEYSYDVMSRLPLEKYADMFKKVMHTAGTRFFGTVVIDTVSNTNVVIADSSVELLPISPLTVQDRQDIYVQDRGIEYIEIRD